MNIIEVLFDPGILFSLANVFTMLQSGGSAPYSIAIVTAAACLFYGILYKGRKSLLPLRINAYGVLIAGLFSFYAGSVLPGIAGLAFGVGNIMASTPRILQLQMERHASRLTKATTHPAVYYGIGYAMVGLMSGGGMALLENPLGNMAALMTTLLGMGATTLSSIGLLSGNFLNPAAPFMTVTFGALFNSMAGIASGNIFGTINNLLAGAGEARLAWMAQDAYEANHESISNAKQPGSGIAKILGFCEKQLLRPLLAARSWAKN